MPEREVIDRAKKDAREGKSPSTQAGEFVREAIEHVREGVYGARSTKQAIAIGLSKARRAGVQLPVPAKGKASSKVREQAERDTSKSRGLKASKPSPTRSRAVLKALKQEGREAASTDALAQQARSSARARGPAARRNAALKAVKTEGRTGLANAARKAARSRSEAR